MAETATQVHSLLAPLTSQYGDPTGAPDERWDLMLGTGLDIAGGADHVSGFNLGLRLHVTESPEVNTHDIGVLFGIGGFYGT